jgi:putative flippase GtrA
MSASPEPDGALPPVSSVTGWCRGLWSNQFLRFLIVGAGNTIIGYLLYLIGLWIGLPYQMALICSTILGATFNFFTTGRIVFENDSLKRIIGFLTVYGIILAINLALLTMLVGWGMMKAYAQMVLLPLIVVLSFVLNKYLVFGKRP